MDNIKTFNEIVYNIINNMHDKLGSVDTKPGTFLRDVIIDPVANEISDIYNSMNKLQLSQSVLTATGDDLDKLAANFFIKRKQGTKSNGKIRLYIKGTDVPITNLEEQREDILVTAGKILSTKGTFDKPSIQFITTEDLLIPGAIINSLPKDSNGYRYVEILCESIETGRDKNIGPYVLDGDVGDFSDQFLQITNPFSFSGGDDPEDDVSLSFRISLALTGSNIGTKKGYLSFILQQPEVLDALVVGAQDEFMTRDIVKVYDDKTRTVTEEHSGGKVDIYVRTDSESKEKYNYTITNKDLENEYHSPQHIVLPKEAYPIKKILNIVGSITDGDNTRYKNYVNADDYELERCLNKKNSRYYLDIEWDFDIKNFFPDEGYNKIPYDLSLEETVNLKTRLDNALLSINNDLQNLSYKIDWDIINWDNGEIEDNPLLKMGQYTDGLYYKVQVDTKTPEGAILGSREFVKKRDKIYVRVYVEPDFKLVRPDNDFYGSIRSLDYIQWFQNCNNVPEVNENLAIQYTYNNGIVNLQKNIESKRIMTADVLIKSAIKKDIEIGLNAKCSASHNPITIKNYINDALSDYINNRKKLGDYLDNSDIVYIVKSIDGVVSVDIDSISMHLINSPNSAIISCKPNEYFYLKNTIVNVSNTPII